MRNASFVAYFLAGALPRLSMLVILFLLARMLPLAETGLFVLVVAVGELLEMPAGSWLRIYVLNREAGRDTLRPHRAGRFLVLGGAATIIAALLSIPAGLVVAPDRLWAFVACVVVYVVAFALLRNVLIVLQMAGDHGRYALVEIARGVSIIPAVVAGAVYGQGDFLAPSLALGGSTLAVAALGLFLARRRLTRPRFSRAGLWPALAFGLAIIADTILSLLISYYDRFVLNQLIGPGSVAIYALAYALGRQPIDFIMGPLNNLALPHLFSVYANEGEAKARDVQTGLSITMFILCAGVLVGMVLLRRPIVELILKPEYWAETIPLVPVVTLGACLVVFRSYLYDNVFHMMHRNAEKLKAILVATLVGMGLMTALIWWKGLTGAALGMLAFSALALVASIITSRRFFTFPVPLIRFAGVAAAALVAGLALEGAVRLVAPYGDIAEIAAGAFAFCLVYALGLSLQGVSIMALASTPWAPLRAAG